MDFGFLEEWVTCIMNFIISNFWSLFIIFLFLLILILVSRVVFKISLFSFISLDFPKEIQVGAISILINRRNKKLAYNIWVELKTRKIALDFDENHDVIIEVYNSWYESFALIREYIKEIGPNKINDQLRTLSIEIINNSMRIHLTRFQAKFRKWFEENNIVNVSPQELQKQFPEYEDLIFDLKETNIACKGYLEVLEKIFR